MATTDELSEQQAITTRILRLILEGNLEQAKNEVVALEGGQTTLELGLCEACRGTTGGDVANWSPTIIQSPSPNHGGRRHLTQGCVIHSTRGGASTPEREFAGTLNWFGRPDSRVSAHIVIAIDGTIAEVVDPTLIAWHAGAMNDTYLGVELVQPAIGDPISDAQYVSLAWWLHRQAAVFRFVLSEASLPEHKDTYQGKQSGKSDVGLPYTFEQLNRFLGGV